jgi:hypothetical protein
MFDRVQESAAAVEKALSRNGPNQPLSVPREEKNINNAAHKILWLNGLSEVRESESYFTFLESLHCWLQATRKFKSPRASER